MSFDNVNFTLAAAVANAGTVTVGYPTGRSQGNYDWTPGKHVLFVAGNEYNAPADFTLTFNVNASDITLTNASGTSWPISSTCQLQIDRVGPEDKDLTIYADPDRVRQIPSPLFVLDLGSPDVADANGFIVSQDLTALGVFSISTTAAAALAAAALAGVTDVPRNVVAAWTTAAVLTVTGKDEFGTVIVESSASGTTFTGKKAFAEVTDVSASVDITGLTVGTGDVLGLPVAVSKVGQVLEVFKDGVREPREAGLVQVPIELAEVELLAADLISVPSPVAGVIKRMVTMVGIAIGTGGTLSLKVNNIAVDGLAVVVANSAPAGALDSDTPTAGHASAIVAVDDEIEIIPDAAFATSGSLYGFVEIIPSEYAIGTLVAADSDKATALTGDVRGTYDPVDACDGNDGYMLLVMAPTPADKGVTQFAG